MRLLTKKMVAEKTGYSAAHLMRMSKAGRFPMFWKPGGGKLAGVRWSEDAVDAWIADQSRAAQAVRQEAITG